MLRRSARPEQNPLVLFQARFERNFERIRTAYRGLLVACVRHRRIFAGSFLAVCVLSFGLYPWLGQDFFPSVDSGELRCIFALRPACV